MPRPPLFSLEITSHAGAPLHPPSLPPSRPALTPRPLASPLCAGELMYSTSPSFFVDVPLRLLESALTSLEGLAELDVFDMVRAMTTR